MPREFEQLYGRLFITGDIIVKTGMHIGGSGGAFAIGGVDKPVITDILTGQPYIPGSSLRGKMRSLTEKYLGKVTGQLINQGEIHACTTASDYATCPICNIYGVAAQDYNLPTRLVVRDAPLRPESADALRRAKTEMPYTEVKTEVSIDRVTSQANPRQIERVPAGAIFSPMEMVFSLYQPSDVDLLATLVDGMTLLEDDYLGGHVSRGSGKIAFANVQLAPKLSRDYRAPVQWDVFPTLAELVAATPEVQNYVRQQVFGS